MQEIKPIYSGKPENFNWVGFGSGSGTNLRECAKVIKPKLIFCDKPSAGLLDLEELAEIPTIIMDGYKWCGSWAKSKDDPVLKEIYEQKSREFNEYLVKSLKDFEARNELNIDLIVLGGYMRLVKEPLLTEFKDKMINVHPADLFIRAKNQRAFTGANACYDALKAGRNKTKSSVIMVDEGEDHGEILVQGPDVWVSKEFLNSSDKENLLPDYAKKHQSIQKEQSDWPALTTALELIANGRLALGVEKAYHNEWRRVYVDGKPLHYEGYQMRGKTK